MHPQEGWKNLRASCMKPFNFRFVARIPQLGTYWTHEANRAHTTGNSSENAKISADWYRFDIFQGNDKI